MNDRYNHTTQARLNRALQMLVAKAENIDAEKLEAALVALKSQSKASLAGLFTSSRDNGQQNEIRYNDIFKGYQKPQL